ncbi:MAG: transcription antitermination factor NusB [Pseudomonadota bacterium]|jgi:N utilization substance protein B|nr:transcription antitermination factor NusB [Pseudomonadota bacterium]|tara:strand:- start:101 stop:559 length:459 start_codon:yes stop_codon:yes gene_type:complete
MNIKPNKKNIRERIKARQNTVQALYQWLITNKDLDEVISEFEDDEYKLAKTDINYFRSLLRGTITHHEELDARIVNLLDRPIDELDTIERAILHIGCYELEYHHDIPWKSIVNESIELAKIFGAEDSYKYINSILDKVAKELHHNQTKDLVS